MPDAHQLLFGARLDPVTSRLYGTDVWLVRQPLDPGHFDRCQAGWLLVRGPALERAEDKVELWIGRGRRGDTDREAPEDKTEGFFVAERRWERDGNTFVLAETRALAWHHYLDLVMAVMTTNAEGKIANHGYQPRPESKTITRAMVIQAVLDLHPHRRRQRLQQRSQV